eukprot:gene25509-34062_t
MSKGNLATMGNTIIKVATKTVAVGFISIGLSNVGDINLIPTSFSILQPAVADVRAQQKRTYFRFAPKLSTGTAFYGSDLKSAIEKDDWDVVAKFFEEYVSKYNPNDKSQVDQTDSYVNNYILRPMKVLSGSFAERGTSPKQKALADKEVDFEKAMTRLEGCTKDMPGEGFFAATIKMPTGNERTKQGLEAWNDGKVAINSYIEIFNDGLMLELNKLKPI